MRGEYLAKISQENPQFPIPLTTRRLSEPLEVNLRAVSLAGQIYSLLKANGVHPVIIGSVSLGFHLGERIAPEKVIHDLDFLISEEEKEAILHILAKAGFFVWDENFIHRKVRNLTGGFGRHHEIGACKENWEVEDGIPYWIGFFTFSGDRKITEFREIYAVSEYKFRIAIESLADLVEGGVVFQRLRRCLNLPLSLELLEEVMEIFSSQGIDFWNFLHSPAINEADIKRRESLPYNYQEKLIEVLYIQRFDVSPEQCINRLDENPAVISPENNFVRMQYFYPHYLGRRRKYMATAEVIRASGVLSGERLEKELKLFKNRKVYHHPLRVVQSSPDITKDPGKLSQYLPKLMSRNISELKGNINPWSLLLPGVHFI